jgi:Holliday junction resolvase-like predicted endonuclease
VDRISPRRQGDLGELSAMEWLGSQGYAVFYPIGRSPDCDLIVDDGCVLRRVQVKTTFQLWFPPRVQSITSQRRLRQRVIKHFSASRCDSLFVAVADGRRWFIPAGAVDGGSGIVVGGPKYADFEVEPGRPLVSERPRSLSSDRPRRGSRAVKGT